MQLFFPGTVLMVCDPYVTVLNKEMGWHPQHCHHCLKRIRRGIPCENCVFVRHAHCLLYTRSSLASQKRSRVFVSFWFQAFYCNESCRQEAEEEYHTFECPCVGYL